MKIPTLHEKIEAMISSDLGLSRAVIEAIELAEQYSDCNPDLFFLPRTETLESFRSVPQRPEIFANIPSFSSK